MRVSRRNGRTTRREHRRFEIIFLTVSLVVACSGVAHLSWAIDSHAHASTPLVEAGNARNEGASAPRYQGSIASQREDESEAASSSDAEAPTDASTQEADAPSPAASDQTLDQGSGASALSPAPTAPSTSIVHHTKYREEVSYRIVHHQASVARDVRENGQTRIEWTACPVCLKRHDAAYNERIVDQVTETPCSACGAHHDADYDETIYR